MKKEDLLNKLNSLKEDNTKREAQVEEWAKQRALISDNIQKAKEDHDFVRGQIATLEEILSVGEQEAKANEHKS